MHDSTKPLGALLVTLGLTALTLASRQPMATAAEPLPGPTLPVLSDPPPSLTTYCSDCPSYAVFPNGLDTVDECPPGTPTYPLGANRCLPGANSDPFVPMMPADVGGNPTPSWCVCWDLEQPDLNVQWVESCDQSLCELEEFSSCNTGCLQVPQVDSNNDGVYWPDDPLEPNPFTTWGMDPMWGDNDGDGLPNLYDVFAAGPLGPISDGVIPTDYLTDSAAYEEFLSFLEQHVNPEGEPTPTSVFPATAEDLDGNGNLTLAEAMSGVMEAFDEMGDALQQAYDGKKDLTAQEQVDYWRDLQEMTQLGNYLTTVLGEAGEGIFGPAFEQLDAWLDSVQQFVDANLDRVTLQLEGPAPGQDYSFTVTGDEGSNYTAKFAFSSFGQLLSAIFLDENGVEIDPEGVGDKKVKNLFLWLTTLVGDPVTTGTGAFVHEEIDLSIAGRGPSFELKRVYDSRSLRRGILGHNWSAGYLESHLMIWPDASGIPSVLQLVWGDGNISMFTRDSATGIYVGEDHEFGKIRVVSEDGYTPCNLAADFPGLVYRGPDGKELHFCAPSWTAGLGRGAVGWLRAASDPYGNALIFRRDNEGKPMEVIDTLGRSIDLEYDETNGLLDTVTDWTGRSVQYTYNARDELVRVDYPTTVYLDGNDTVASGSPYVEYTYDEDPLGYSAIPGSALNHNLQSISHDGGAPSVTLTYYSTGYSYDKVSSHTVAGGTSDYRYFSIPEGTSAYGDAVTHLTEMRSPDGEVSRFFHGAGLLYGHEELNGRADLNWTIVGDVYSNPDEGFTNGAWITQLEYDDESRMTRVLRTGDGYGGLRETLLTYDTGNADRFQQRNLLSVTTVPSETGNGEVPVTWTYSYDPLTTQAITTTDNIGRVWNRTFAHQEDSYDAVRTGTRVKGWDVLPDPAIDPARAASLQPLFGQGDVNSDGVIGGSFEAVRMEMPQVDVPDPDGPSGAVLQVLPTELMQYNAHGQITGVRNRQGTWTTFQYSGGLLATRVADPGGFSYTESYVYDGLSRITRTDFPDGRSRELAYDGRDRVIEVRQNPGPGIIYSIGMPPPPHGGLSGNAALDSLDIAYRIFFDKKGRPAGRTAPSFVADGSPGYAAGLSPQLVSRQSYDVADRLTSITETTYLGTQIATQGTWTYQYNGANLVAEEETPNGARYEYTYDSRGHILEVEAFDGTTSDGTWTADYNTFGERTRVTNPLLAAQAVAYDGHGRTLSVTSALGITTDYAYDAAGRVLSEKTGGGSFRHVTYNYDALDRRTQERHRNLQHQLGGGVTPLTPEWTQIDYGFGVGEDQLYWKTVQGAANSIERYVYDGLERRTTTKWGAGEDVLQIETFDSQGRVLDRTVRRDGLGTTGLKSPSEAVYVFHYDAHGRLRHSYNPNGDGRTTYHTADGSVQEFVDENGRSLQFVRDSAGRPWTETETGAAQQLAPRVTARVWDVESNLLSILDPEQNTTTFGHDVFGRRTSKIFADATSITYEYDTNGRLDKVTRPGNVIWDYDYDVGDRLQSLVATGAGADVTRTYRYDVLDNVTEVLETCQGRAAIEVKREYTTLDRLALEAQVLGGTMRSTAASYDGVGRLKTMTYPSQFSIDRTYDDKGRTLSIGVSGGSTLATFSQHYGLSRPGFVSLDGGGTKEFCYEPSGRLTERQTKSGGGVKLSCEELAYDPVGNVLERTLQSSLLTAPVKEDFAYDEFDRITAWDYDTQNGPTRSSTWGWDGADALSAYTDTIAAPGGATGTVNSLNQLTALPPIATTHTYSPRGERESQASGGVTDTITWDAMGRPYSGVYHFMGIPVPIEYCYDGLDRVVATDDPLNGFVQYTYFGDQITEVIEVPGQVVEVVGGYDPSIPMWQRRGVDESYLDVSVDGNVRGLFDSSSVLESYHYTPFGESVDMATATTPTFSTNGNRLYFQARPFLNGPDVSFLGARVYEPQTFGFLSRDPLEEAPGPNLYAYGRANPVRFADPSGLSPHEVQSVAGEEVSQAAEALLSQRQDKTASFVGTSPVAIMDWMVWSWSAGTSEDGSALFSDSLLEKFEEGNGFVGLGWLDMREVLDVYVQNHEYGDTPQIDATLAWAKTGKDSILGTIGVEAFDLVLNLPENAMQYGFEKAGFDPLAATIASETIGFFAGFGWARKPLGKGVRALGRLNRVLGRGAKIGRGIPTPRAGTEIVQRAMSRGELRAIQGSGVLSRRGRAGSHYVSDAVNSGALRARQRLALPGTPEVRVTLEVPSGIFGPPSRVGPNFGMPGGGMERSAAGSLDIPAKVLDVWNY